MFTISSIEILKSDLADSVNADRARLAKARIEVVAIERANRHSIRTKGYPLLTYHSMMEATRDLIKDLENLIGSIERDGGLYNDDGTFIPLEDL